MTEAGDHERRIARLEAGAVDQRLFDERTHNLQASIERIEKRQEAGANLLKTAIVGVLVNLVVTVIGGVLLTVLLK